MSSTCLENRFSRNLSGLSQSIQVRSSVSGRYPKLPGSFSGIRRVFQQLNLLKDGKILAEMRQMLAFVENMRNEGLTRTAMVHVRFI